MAPATARESTSYSERTTRSRSVATSISLGSSMISVGQGKAGSDGSVIVSKSSPPVVAGRPDRSIGGDASSQEPYRHLRHGSAWVPTASGAAHRGRESVSRAKTTMRCAAE